MAHWQNRIIGHEDVVPDQLLANPFNFKIHTKYQQDALSGLIAEIGIIQSVLVNKQTGHMIDGHCRVSLAISRNEPTIPVTYVDLSPDEEKKALALFDPIGALASTDHQQLTDLLAQVQTQDPNVQAVLDALAKDPHLETVQFEAASTEKITCPTCGRKLKKGQTLPPTPQSE